MCVMGKQNQRQKKCTTLKTATKPLRAVFVGDWVSPFQARMRSVARLQVQQNENMDGKDLLCAWRGNFHRPKFSPFKKWQNTPGVLTVFCPKKTEDSAPVLLLASVWA